MVKKSAVLFRPKAGKSLLRLGLHLRAIRMLESRRCLMH